MFVILFSQRILIVNNLLFLLSTQRSQRTTERSVVKESSQAVPKTDVFWNISLTSLHVQGWDGELQHCRQGEQQWAHGGPGNQPWVCGYFDPPEENRFQQLERSGPVQHWNSFLLQYCPWSLFRWYWKERSERLPRAWHRIWSEAQWRVHGCSSSIVMGLRVRQLKDQLLYWIGKFMLALLVSLSVTFRLWIHVFVN